jgi:hypothetical protein
MPRLVRRVCLIWPDLAAPGVGADRGDILVLKPVAGFERQAGRIAGSVSVPVLLGEAALLMASAHDDKVALANLDALSVGAGVELGRADGVAVRQGVEALEASDVEQDAAADHLVAHVLDATHRENATQSSVSQHIDKLEARSGPALFSRDTGAIHLTPAGDLYYRYCIEILRGPEASRNEMKRFGSGLSAEIVVGLMPTMTRSVLGPALATLVRENPNAQVRIVEGFSALLTDACAPGNTPSPLFRRFRGRLA